MATSRFLLSKLIRRVRLVPIITTSSFFSIQPHHLISISSPNHTLLQLLAPHSLFFPHNFSTSEPHHENPDHDDLINDVNVDSSNLGSAEITNVLSNVTAEQDSILPVRALISLLDGFHDLTGLPWWVVIIYSTFALRIALFPFVVLQLTKLKQISEFLPKLPRPFPPPLSGKSYIDQFRRFEKRRKEINCPSMLWFLSGISIQMPCFLLGVTTVRRMALNNHPGFESGGALWFQNLSELPHLVPGATFPVLIAGLHLLNVYLSFSKLSIREWAGGVGSFMRSYKFLLDGLFVPILFVGFYVPQGSLVYWVTNSLSTFTQHLCINNASFRKYYGLPVKDGVSNLPARNPQEIGATGVTILDTSRKQQKVSVETLTPKELVNLSIQMLAKGHKERAVPLLRLALDKDPEHIRALIVLGQTLLQDQLLVEAVKCLDHAVSNILCRGSPTNVEVDQLILASMWSGVAYIRQQRNTEGIAHLERIAQMKEPDDAKSKAHYYDGLLMLASALTNEGRKPEAEKYLRMAAAYNSSYNVYLEQLLNEEDHSVGDLLNHQEKGSLNSSK